LSAVFAVLVLTSTSPAKEMVDLTKAVVVSPPGTKGPEAKAVQMLIEEVAKRSHVQWERAEKITPDDVPIIVVGTTKNVIRVMHEIDVDLRINREESYTINIGTWNNRIRVLVNGETPRGCLFGVGRLLRELRIERTKVTLPADFKERSAPQTPLRGHQLGYRPKTNSYDGWTVAMWEQYYRDLIVFGCNTIELIPPRSDDAADSPHFPLPPLRMMTEMSRLANEYGLDVWVWYPAMDANYADPKTVEFALKEWGEVFKACPRIDAVMVPGGDPGHTPPKVLFPFLEKQAANLKKYHPKAGMWVSAQSFDKEKLADFVELVKAEPKWLAGVAAGPQVRVPLEELRRLILKKYPIRDYPDITHSRHCQYPVPGWDLAFALTEGREICNPRPTQMAAIYKYASPHTNGFITYSEGCHDDVNKMIWSALGWNRKADVKEVLRQYSRYFIGPAYEEKFAEGLFALERNWVGPIVKNDGIEKTLDLFMTMDKAAPPPVKLNWRFQQALYRAYYDGFVRKRLFHELMLEMAAREHLGKAPTIGVNQAIRDAEAELVKAKTVPLGQELRARVFELAEALFQSIHAQLSVKKYGAIAIERGANLDSINVPLNNAGNLQKLFEEVDEIKEGKDQIGRLSAYNHRTMPGSGNYYDCLGDPFLRPHLVQPTTWEEDPAYFQNPLTGFGFRNGTLDSSRSRAWLRHAESLYDAPLTLKYTGLDPKATYRVKAVYNKERLNSKIRLTANDGLEIHPYLGKAGEELEFPVPAAATASGTLELHWNQPPGAGGSGRGCQVCEVWLIKQQTDAKAVTPLKNAHAHNDYEHKRPLFDALDNGFNSVEADVYLIDGKLLVAHNRKDVKPNRTLESLYLDPLRARVKANGGRVYKNGPSIFLLVDVKTGAEATYAALDKVLAKYADIVSVTRGGKFEPKAVTVVVSGNRAKETIAKQTVRYAGIDGRPEDLESDVPAHQIPWISASWVTQFKWLGTGPMPGDQRAKLKAFTEKAHAKGRLVRFWATPEKEVFWKELLDDGVDLINTDKLPELRAFLLKK
jgi:hypothetical protein